MNINDSYTKTKSFFKLQTQRVFSKYIKCKNIQCDKLSGKDLSEYIKLAKRKSCRKLLHKLHMPNASLLSFAFPLQNKAKRKITMFKHGYVCKIFENSCSSKVIEISVQTNTHCSNHLSKNHCQCFLMIQNRSKMNKIQAKFESEDPFEELNVKANKIT